MTTSKTQNRLLVPQFTMAYVSPNKNVQYYIYISVVAIPLFNSPYLNLELKTLYTSPHLSYTLHRTLSRTLNLSCPKE
jgi:hypothetical protein